MDDGPDGRRSRCDWRRWATPSRSARSTTTRCPTPTATFDLVPRSLATSSSGSPIATVRSRRSSPSIRPTSGRRRRLRLAVAVQGAGRLPHQRRGLGLRAPRPQRPGHRQADRQRAAASRRGFGLPRRVRPDLGGERGLDRPAPVVRVRAGRHRARGRPQVQPLARRRHHASPPASHSPRLARPVHG